MGEQKFAQSTVLGNLFNNLFWRAWKSADQALRQLK
jgi:hypothetical protein